jgi:hypothetical protein
MSPPPSAAGLKHLCTQSDISLAHRLKHAGHPSQHGPKKRLPQYQQIAVQSQALSPDNSPVMFEDSDHQSDRIIREIRRRTRVVGAFPDGNTALLLGAVRLQLIAGTRWGTKQYLDMKQIHYDEAA